MASLNWQSFPPPTGGRPVPRSVQTVGAVAGDTLALVTGSTDGMLLVDVGGFAVFAVADVNQTITAAVNALAYTQNPYTGLWGRCEAFDIVGQTVVGVRQAQIGAFRVDSPCGRVAYQNNGGTVSSGGLNFQLVATRTRINGGLL